MLAVAPLRAAAAVPTLYALMSFNEYVTHRYYQHAEFNKTPWMQRIASAVWLGRTVPVLRGGGHIEHHAETLDDMTLKTDTRWRSGSVAKSLDGDEYRGTAFSWSVAAMMMGQMVVTGVPVFKLLGFSLSTTLAMLAPALALHTLVWNCLHPNMHALPDVPMAFGPPSSVLARFRSSRYFRFLYANHQGHHIVGGRGNYNVACPGADHLLGTFVPEATWRPLTSSTYASHHGEDVDFDQQIKNHVARQKFGLGAQPPTAPTLEAAPSPVAELESAY